jgi:SH3 domain
MTLGDLSLVKGEEYTVVDDSQDHWWQGPIL